METPPESTPLKHPDAPKMAQKGLHCFLVAAAFIACLISFSAGIALAWASPVLAKLKAPSESPFGRLLHPSEESWIAALTILGGSFGPLPAGRCADKIGRKRTLLLLAVPMIASLAVCAFAATIPLFYAARFLMGLSVGAVFTVLPIYLSEIAQDHNRGTITSFLVVFASSGILFAYSIGPFLTIRNFCLVCITPLAIFLALFGAFIPDTPAYLASINHQKGLEASLRKYRAKNGAEIFKEMAELNETSKNEQNGRRGCVRDFFRIAVARKAMLIVLGLMFFQQFAGINAVLPYMELIFSATGAGPSAELSTILVGCVQVLTTLTCAAVVERLGRRTLLLISAFGCSLALVSLGGFFYVKDGGFRVDAVGWLPVASLLVYIVAFNLGFAGMPWTIMTELYAPSLKSLGSTIATSFVFFMGFLITLLFPMVAVVSGMAVLFWISAGICLFAAAFVVVFVPETKGRTLVELQAVLSGDAKK